MTHAEFAILAQQHRAIHERRLRAIERAILSLQERRVTGESDRRQLAAAIVDNAIARAKAGADDH